MTEKLHRYDFKEGLPIGFEIVRLGDLYARHNELMTMAHRTNFYHIIWFQTGSPTHLIDFEPISIQPQSMVFLKKDVVQRFDKNVDFDGLAILFTDDFFCQTEADATFLRTSILFHDLLSIPQIHLKEHLPVFEELFALMDKEMHLSNDAYHADVLRNYLHNLLLMAERVRRDQAFTELRKGPHLDYILVFNDLLEEQFKINKAVSHYAGQMHITPKRLSQSTSRVLGKTAQATDR